jgi:hypothetical protein
MIPKRKTTDQTSDKKENFDWSSHPSSFILALFARTFKKNTKK